MNHVMLDIETMGTGANACIVAIGAFRFNKDTNFVAPIEFPPKNTFYELPQWEGDMDYATVQWWLMQPKEAQNALKGGSEGLKTVLHNFVQWVGNDSVWGNGSDFDNAIVLSHCKRLGIKPWSYRNNRCFRTVKNLYDSAAYTEPTIPHHALYDAIAQAETLVKLSFIYGIPL